MATVRDNAAETRAPACMRPRTSRVWWVLYAVTIAIVALLLVEGFSYYSTPYRERPHHEDYRTFRPAGRRGILYGIVGSAMMLVMHLYSLRKRRRRLQRFGGMRTWLNMHIFFGIIGPVFIVLHTSFKVQGLVAVSFWSMVGVALSGFVGRFLYQQIPRSISGDELTAAELERQIEEMQTRLTTESRLTRGTAARLESIARADNTCDQHPLRALSGMLAADLSLPVVRSRVRTILHASPELSARERRELADLSVRLVGLKRRRAVLEMVRKLFHYWHIIHKPFAVVMYTIMAVHIGVAVWTGYGWIF